MRETLFSPHWYRVAEQRPALAPGVRVVRQHVRDQTWYVLVNELAGRQYRVSEAAYEVLGRCNGSRTVDDVWQALLDERHDDAPTQHEVVGILSQLDRENLLTYEGAPDVDALLARRDETAKKRRRSFLNPFAFQVPLGDPTRLLGSLAPVARFFAHPAAIALWAIAMIAALGALVVSWPALSAHARAHMGTPHYLLLAWLAFPLIKAVHELGHGLVLRRLGGEAHAAGITLLALTPAPYVDASAAGAFRSRYQRALVSGMGIIVEASIAAAALFLWLAVQPGLVRDVAFVVMFTAGVSTVLFNGNPLFKFDGYYVLCDLFDLPNLASRSRLYWIECFQRLACGAGGALAVEPARGERKWLIAYAPLATVYRTLTCVLLILWLGSYSFVLGALAGAFLAVSLVRPLVAAVLQILHAPSAGRWRPRAVVSGSMAAVAAALCVLPFPFHTAARGVVWVPDQAQVRAETDGFVAAIDARDGDTVEPGDRVLVLTDPDLTARRAVLESELEQLRAEMGGALRGDARAPRDFAQELARIDAETARLDEKRDQLELRAQAAGTLVVPRQQDLPGMFVKRGTTVGYVLNGEVGVRVAVPERDAALIRARTHAVEVRMAEAAGERIAAHLVREVPAAARELPSAALSDRGGGPFIADTDDKAGLRIVEPVVLVDLRLPERELERIGGRVWVRFDHGAAPLASQWYRRARQLFLQHFNPAA